MKAFVLLSLLTLALVQTAKADEFGFFPGLFGLHGRGHGHPFLGGLFPGLPGLHGLHGHGHGGLVPGLPGFQGLQAVGPAVGVPQIAPAVAPVAPVAPVGVSPVGPVSPVGRVGVSPVGHAGHLGHVGQFGHVSPRIGHPFLPGMYGDFDFGFDYDRPDFGDHYGHSLYGLSAMRGLGLYGHGHSHNLVRGSPSLGLGGSGRGTMAQQIPRRRDNGFVGLPYPARLLRRQRQLYGYSQPAHQGNYVYTDDYTTQTTTETVTENYPYVSAYPGYAYPGSYHAPYPYYGGGYWDDDDS